MFLKKISRITTFLSHLTKRSYYSSRINNLFLENVNKYSMKLNTESSLEASHKTKTIAKLLDEFNEISGSIQDVNKELTGDSHSDIELSGLFKEEKLEMESKRNELITRVLNEIHSYEQSKDNERIPDSSSVVFEVSAGVGGREAMLFANELCVMYINFFNFKNWDILDEESDEQGGYLRHYQARIEGRDVWGFMRFEAGVHRVQRVPETEARGRVHTSTVSLACIPITDDSGVEINGEQQNFSEIVIKSFNLQKRI